MKRAYIILTLSLFIGCTKSSPEGVESISSDQVASAYSTATSGIRSNEEISGIALKAVQDFSSSTKTKSAIRHKEIKDIIPSAVQTKSDAEEPLFFVVNFTNDNGFVIVGADVNSPEVIAYTEKGYYDGSSSSIEGFNIYMEELTSKLAGLRSNPGGGGPIGPGVMYTEIDTSTTFTTVGPLLEVQWHQDYPFNMFCPIENGIQTKAGCVAIAMGQIMSYHESPSSIVLTYPNADSISVSLNWTQMKLPLHTGWHTDLCPYCRQNGYLIREIGERVFMSYGVGVSVADCYYVPYVFGLFNYSCSDIALYDLNTVSSNITNSKPVFIWGYNPVTKLTEPGHAWVTDGEKISDFHKKVYNVTTFPFSRVLVLDEHVVNTYLHFNYGGGGASDGFYLAKQRKYGQGSVISGGSYDYITVSMFTGIGFNDNVHIVANIHPQ